MGRFIIYGLQGGIFGAMGHVHDKVYFTSLAFMVLIDFYNILFVEER